MEEGRFRPNGNSFVSDYFLKDHLGNVRMMLDEGGTVLEETSYYPFGLTMKGIAYQNLSVTTNRYKYNGGTELNEDLGIGFYETMNRSYDPQLGRFLQVDEFGEVNEEWTPYNFAINNPISFNDPLGLKEGPGDEKTLENVTVVGFRKGDLWGKTNAYYALMRRTQGNLDLIVNNGLREQMRNIDRIVKFRERIAEQTRKDDELTLEVAGEIATWLIPVGKILKIKKLEKLVKLFNLKRGKAVVRVAEEVVEHIDEAANLTKQQVKSISSLEK